MFFSCCSKLGSIITDVYPKMDCAGHPAALRKHLMLLLVDLLSVSPRLTTELKACLQPAALALMDALTPFEASLGKGCAGKGCA